MEFCGFVDLPDGRSVYAELKGFTERDTNAWVETSLEIEWESGEELTAEEMNEDLGEWFLHEYVATKLLESGGQCGDDGDYWV